MTFLDRLKRLAGRRAARRQSYARAWNAAKKTRLTEDWAFSASDANAELKGGLRPIRERARTLEQNNDYFRKYLGMLENNVIGRGIKLQMRIKDPNGTPDTGANRIIEEAWHDWSCHYATVGGMTFTEASKLALRSTARDGECISLLMKGAENPYGFTMRLLEGDYLDDQYCEELKGGRSVYMAVEMDSLGVPQAYWLDGSHPGNWTSKRRANKRQRVGREDMILLKKTERPGAVRGISWAAASMPRLNMLEGYIEAETVAARLGASKMGFYKYMPGEELQADNSDVNMPVTDVSPGTFEKLPTGWDITQWDPTHPTTAFADFVKGALRGISSGLGVTYNGLANDLEGVNFSSLREGKLAERDEWIANQEWMIRHWNRRIFAVWLEMFLTSGMSNLPLSKMEKFHADTWQPRRWAWVDPLKDLQANEIARGNLWMDDTTIVAEQSGMELREIYERIQSDETLAAEFGLTKVVTDKGVNNAGNTGNPIPPGE